MGRNSGNPNLVCKKLLYVDNNGADQSVHAHKLFNIFVIFIGSISYIMAKKFVSRF